MFLKKQAIMFGSDANFEEGGEQKADSDEECKGETRHEVLVHI